MTKLGLERLTLWAKLRTAEVLRFRYILISKKLSGWSHLIWSKAHWWQISFLFIQWCLEGRVTQALGLRSRMFSVVYMYTHISYTHWIVYIHNILYKYLHRLHKTYIEAINITCRDIWITCMSRWPLGHVQLEMGYGEQVPHRTTSCLNDNLDGHFPAEEALREGWTRWIPKVP